MRQAIRSSPARAASCWLRGTAGEAQRPALASASPRSRRRWRRPACRVPPPTSKRPACDCQAESRSRDANRHMRATKASVPDAQGQIEIVGAAVVTRDPDGRVDVKSEPAKLPAPAPRAAASSASKQLQPTRTAFVAQVTEQSPDVIDAAIARLGGEIIRRPVSEGEQEIAAARDPQRKGEHEAGKELRSGAPGIRA